MSECVTQPPSTLCPSCNVQLSPEAILCVACGYDKKSGVQLRRATVGMDATTAPDLSNPFASPSSALEAQESHDSAIDQFVRLFSFRGRVSRRYWWLVHLSFAILEVPFALQELGIVSLGQFEFYLAIPVIAFLWVILATHVKRWHDINRTGWWVMVNNIPVFGMLYSLVELGFQSGTIGANAYGEDPVGRYAESEAA